VVRENDETRPRLGDGPDDNTNRRAHHNRGPLQVADSPTQNVLDRLEGVHRAGNGWTAKCPGPNHRRGDKSLSLSVSEGSDGRTLLYCFAGCSADDVVRAIRLELRDLFPPRPIAWPAGRRLPSPQPITLPGSVAEILVETSEFAEAWELVKLLATEEPELARQDLLASWEHLEDYFDIPNVLRLAYALRGVGMFRYCDAARANDPTAVNRAVRRLINELEAAERVAA
jgi:hypothetical protein